MVQQAGGDISFLLPAAASTEVHAGVSANTATYCVSLYTANLRNGGTSGQVSGLTLRGVGMHNVVNHWALCCSRETPAQVSGLTLRGVGMHNVVNHWALCCSGRHLCRRAQK